MPATERSRTRLEHLATFNLELVPPLGGDPGTASDAIPLTVPLAVPWNVPVRLNAWGDTVAFDEGSLTPPAPARVKLLLDHRPDKPFGYGSTFTSTPAGLAAELVIPRAELEDPDVARAVRQMGNGVRDAVSVGADFDDTTETINADGTVHVQVHTGRLVELSTVVVPRFDDARHDPLVASKEGTAMPTDTIAPPSSSAATGSSTEGSAPPPTDGAELEASRAAAHTATLTALGGLIVRAEPHPLARFGSLAEYTIAKRNDPSHVPDLAAVWIDQITPNNPGVLPPTWLTEVFGIINNGRPFINALGGPASAGDSGTTIQWPYYDGDLSLLVGVQAAEKTEITSVRVDIKAGSEALLTYAGGSDISYQLLLRSSPSYLAAYSEIMAAAYALTTDKAAVTEANAAAGDYVLVNFATATADAIAAALFEASAKVARATGSPATVVSCANDVYGQVAAAVFKMGSAPSGNVAGASASAAGLTINLAGLAIVNDPYQPAGTALVTNRQAGRWFEDGPRTVTADDVPKLGMDYAIWGLGAWGTLLPMGIIELVATAPTAAATKAK